MSAGTYTRLRNGDWGVRVPESDAAEGTSVLVRKRSGETKKEVIARVVWRGDGVAICAISRAPRRRDSGLHYERGVGLVCDECGDRVERGSTCWETGLVH